MNIKKLKKIIIALIIIVLIVAVILVIVLKNNNNGNDENADEDTANFTQEEIANDNVIDENSIDQFEYFSVSDCISSYLGGINQNSSAYYGTDENGNYVKVIDQEEINKVAYNMLSNEYIQNKGITTENVFDKIQSIDKDVLFIPVEMKANNNGENVKRYMVYGYTSDIDYNFVDNIYVIVNMDVENKTFSIEPITKDEYDKGELKDDNTRIEANDNNTYTVTQYDEDSGAEIYFSNYKKMMLSNPEVAYNFLNEEYRNRAFADVNQFKEYIQNNRDAIIEAMPASYDINTNGEYAEYVEKDKKDKYSIFNISNEVASKYNVMLDTYTVGTTEFLNQYNDANDEEKVTLNANRFIYALNDRNYFAYKVLDDTFKQNNFDSWDKFKDYINNNFFENNVPASKAKVTKEGNNYVCNIQVKNSNDDNAETKNIVIIMKLLEGTDFTMSFSIK